MAFTSTDWPTWIDAASDSNTMTDSDFSSDSQRTNGFSAGTAASSKRVNSILRETSIATSAFMKVFESKYNAYTGLTNSGTTAYKRTQANVESIVQSYANIINFKHSRTYTITSSTTIGTYGCRIASISSSTATNRQYKIKFTCPALSFECRLFVTSGNAISVHDYKEYTYGTTLSQSVVASLFTPPTLGFVVSGSAVVVYIRLISMSSASYSYTVEIENELNQNDTSVSFLSTPSSFGALSNYSTMVYASENSGTLVKELVYTTPRMSLTPTGDVATDKVIPLTTPFKISTTSSFARITCVDGYYNNMSATFENYGGTISYSYSKQTRRIVPFTLSALGYLISSTKCILCLFPTQVYQDSTDQDTVKFSAKVEIQQSNASIYGDCYSSTIKDVSDYSGYTAHVFVE